ncbi:unnamed protein product [Paramecium sonneborni]|uniref:RING-type domain-containing protein n=1 Tax=Paramecium sonneborni TaxID=65129 RepID=A0A8S1PUJ7_9CILI|nr:unnamed protein product [Paramecium sonneborni]
MNQFQENSQESEFSFQGDQISQSDNEFQDQNNSDKYSQQCSFDGGLKDSLEIIKDMIKKERLEKNNKKDKEQQLYQHQKQQNGQQQASFQIKKQKVQQPNNSEKQEIKKQNQSENFQMLENNINEDFDSDWDVQDLFQSLNILLEDSKKCQFCSKEMNKNNLKSHEDQCAYKVDQYDEIQCPYCGDNVIRAFVNDHFQECILYYEDQFLKLEGVQECSICMNEIKEKKKVLNCHHFFHYDCIKDWLSKKMECPVCRKQVLEGFN